MRPSVSSGADTVAVVYVAFLWCIGGALTVVCLFRVQRMAEYVWCIATVSVC